MLSDCLRSHRSCAEARHNEETKSRLPKRVLDVSNNDKIFLKETSMDEHDDYICLSHCWGQSDTVLKTVVSSLDQFKAEIPWERLSKTFQDAIHTVRALGVKYLWIDSLCIVQESVNDPGDWSVESGNMTDIYSNSLLTVAATWAKDGTDGLFSDVNAHTLGYRDTEIFVRTCHSEFG